MTAITRVDDIGQGYCTCHKKNVIVVFQQGCKTVLAEDKELGAVEIIVGRASCGHPTIAKIGSSTVFSENKGVHRIHDTGEIGPGCGTYSVSTGSPTVFADEGEWEAPEIESFDVGPTAPPELREPGGIVPSGGPGTTENPNSSGGEIAREAQQSECAEGFISSTPDPESPEGVPDLQPNKIVNTTIPVHCDLSIKTSLKLSSDSTLLEAVTWSINPLPPGIFLDQTTGVISGIVSIEGTYDFDVEVKSGEDVIDKKHFKIEAKPCTGKEVYMINPLASSYLRAPFGELRHKDNGTSYRHGGVDLCLKSRGQGPVLAAASGICLFSGIPQGGINSGYGNHIILGHLDETGQVSLTTLYGHLARRDAIVGSKYSQGQVIGLEGTTGKSTGNHLHFEVRTPDFCSKPGRPVNYAAAKRDPWPYIQGTTIINTRSNLDTDDVASPIVGNFGESVPARTSDISETCSGYNSPQTSDGGNGNPTPGDNTKPAKSNGKRSECAPSGPVQTKQQVIDQINSVLDTDSSLTNADKKFIIYTAGVESNFDPYATTPPSLHTTATGLFQMVDMTAGAYGLTSCEDRCNIEKSTKAMIRFHKEYIKHNYNQLVNSGFTKCNGGSVPAYLTSKYSSLQPEAMMYMIHHDGANNIRKGKDVGGLEYFNRTYGKS